MIINGNLHIIGVDTGNRNIKTASTQPVVAGYMASESALPLKNVLYFDGRYYAHTDSRVARRPDKTHDMDYYILTLMAIGGELLKNEKMGGHYNVVLALGLPPGSFRVKDLKDNFEKYFTQRQLVSFGYAGDKYTLDIVEAITAPQAYASVVPILDRLEKYPRVLIIDIGGGTVDFMELMNGEPTANVLKSLPWGTINMYEQITEYFDNIGDPVSETAIDDVLLSRLSVVKAEKQEIIYSMASSYIKDLFKAIKARGYPISDDYVVFTGGGSILFEKQLREIRELNAYEFITDICANAKGFERMVNNVLNRRRRAV